MSNLPKQIKVKYRRELYKLFEDIPQDELLPIVELGVAEGNNSEDMLRWPVKFPRLYMVDEWMCAPRKGDSSMSQAWHDANYARVIERTKDFLDRAACIRRHTVEAASLFTDNSLHLVYVDADHSYDGCKADIEAWFPKLIQGGVMAFHDYKNKAYGVNKAVKEFAQARGLAIFPLPEDKPEDAGAYVFKC